MKRPVALFNTFPEFTKLIFDHLGSKGQQIRLVNMPDYDLAYAQAFMFTIGATNFFGKYTVTPRK